MSFLMPLVALTVVIFMSYSFIPVSEEASEDEVTKVFVEGDILAESTCACPERFDAVPLADLSEEDQAALGSKDRNEDGVLCLSGNLDLATLPDVVLVAISSNAFRILVTDNNKCN